VTAVAQTPQGVDRHSAARAVKILPGQWHAARGDVVINTVLGSCVSACLWDPAGPIGGMNHFMLPGDGAPSAWPASARFGVYAMEVLINDLLRLGADRRRLVAKVFGGARLLAGPGTIDVGARNAGFALEFLRVEGIRLLAQDLRDAYPRKVRFFVGTGKVQVQRLNPLPAASVRSRERAYLRALSVPRGGEVEIFGAPR
jgi:chemotaxis protein CheD